MLATMINIQGLYFAILLYPVVAFVLRTPAISKSRRSGVRATKNDANGFPKAPVDLILIDHYDSFTYNLVDMLTQLCGKPPSVFPCDSADTWDELRLKFDLEDFDGIVLSPGPGHPKDCKLALDCVASNPSIPILGVCLGHQIIGLTYSSTIDHAPRPIHGQIQSIDILDISEDSVTLFEGIDRLSVTRYHSLHVVLNENSMLKPTAISKDDDVLMAMKHTKFPHWGLQFHPESIGTSHGMNLLGNFVKQCASRCKAKTDSPAVASENNTRKTSSLKSPAVAWIHRVPNLPSNGSNMKPEDVMEEILADDEFSYWLDHSDTMRLPGTSMLGSSSWRVEYYGKEKSKTGVRVVNSIGHEEFHDDQDILDYLEQHIPLTIDTYHVDFIGSKTMTVEADQFSLPFDFCGGFVGYLGYEGRLNLTQTKQSCTSTQSSDENVPTAAFLWADRSFVYSHETCQWYLVGTYQGDEDSTVAEWMSAMSRRLQLGAGQRRLKTRATDRLEANWTPTFVANRSPETYGQNFDRCLHHIHQGDSYELCLTNQIETYVPDVLKPLDLHKILRRKNPAPYSAYLNWGDRFAVCSSSPERFLSVKDTPGGDLLVEAKPIKGTIARVIPENGDVRSDREQLLDHQRAMSLKQSVKDRAENLMIVDLLRNDLSRVCRPGTVHVSKLMGIESYATVHQMVSTIRGSLDRSSKSSIDVLRSCFPGGSMTGAPKIRSMEILNELEDDVARGPYSGCMGYLSLNGSMDMSILIRTAVLSKVNNNWKVRIGAGGAITALSDRESEFHEMMLKADVVMKSVKEWAAGPGTGNKVHLLTSKNSSQGILRE